ncbi:TIGR03663 family protein [Methanomicrobium antiquum]|uniref:TIGR03663 family protein n=1 Tax=Methanomicrobium antiquum TaxID=487686 RepID=A0AAF0FLK5_9EURY|nr:flippase activity-associated protein Agl23 [Methanomicrobium antiquum]WFN36105.1 TIGR03663 family protein [Methanomicrobium antiquum]
MRAANFSSQFGKFFTVERTLLIILVTALLLRFLFLDLKLLHHDEAIHSWFSINLLRDGIHSYSYDPVYHGPFLYFITSGMFGLFGSGDLIARIIPSLLGTFAVGLIYPIYKLGYLDGRQTIIAGLFIAISPSMVYFSRFLRNDILILFFTLVLLVSVLYYLEKNELKYVISGAAAIGFAMSCKENVPIILLIFGVYILYLFYTKKAVLPKYWIRDLIIAIALAAGIMAVLYSSFGAYPQIIIDGPSEAINHWLSMHEEQRLGGPFYYYIILFLLYELPILVLAIFGIFSFLKKHDLKNTNLKQNFEDECEGRPDVDADAEKSEINEEIKKKILKPIAKIDKNREFTRFCIFWMLASLAIYAYIGEKVPWLILHQLIPMIFVAVYDLSRLKIWICAAGVIFLALMMVHVSFTPADISEPIVQVQNSEDLRDVMVFVDFADRVAISNEVRWPFVWYYVDDYPKKIAYYSEGYDSSIGPEDYDVIILHDGEGITDISGYSKYTYKKCYWIDVYNLVQSTRYKADLTDENYRNAVIGDVKRLLSYYFTRDTNLGSINLDVFVKNRQAA